MVKWIIFDIDGVLVSNGKINQNLLNYCYRLKDKGFKLGIISNYSASFADKYHLNGDLFSITVFADTLGIRKPDPQVFKYFCQLASCRPDECLFLDDNWPNVYSAKLFGMNSFLYENINEFKKKLKPYL